MQLGLLGKLLRLGSTSYKHLPTLQGDLRDRFEAVVLIRKFPSRKCIILYSHNAWRYPGRARTYPRPELIVWLVVQRRLATVVMLLKFAIQNPFPGFKEGITMLTGFVGRFLSIFTLEGLISSTGKLSLAISIPFPDCREEILSWSAGRNYWLFLYYIWCLLFWFLYSVVRLHVMLSLVLLVVSVY